MLNETPSQVLIVENDLSQKHKWVDIFKEVDPSISIIWAFTQDEASGILFDSFMNETKFDFIVSKAEFLEINWRLDVQKSLIIVSQEGDSHSWMEAITNGLQ